MTGGFRTFGPPHLVVMALTVALPVLLSLIAKRAGPRTATAVGYVLAVLLLGNELIHWGFRITGYGLDIFLRYFLPLHLCGIAIFLTSITLLFRNQKVYEIRLLLGPRRVGKRGCHAG